MILAAAARAFFSQVDDLIKTMRRLRIGLQIYEGDSNHGDMEGTNRGKDIHHGLKRFFTILTETPPISLHIPHSLPLPRTHLPLAMISCISLRVKELGIVCLVLSKTRRG